MAGPSLRKHGCPAPDGNIDRGAERELVHHNHLLIPHRSGRSTMDRLDRDGEPAMSVAVVGRSSGGGGRRGWRVVVLQHGWCSEIIRRVDDLPQDVGGEELLGLLACR